MISTPAQTITIRRLQPMPVNGVRNFKLIGTGGTGGLLARALSLLLASLEGSSRLVLIDGDDYDLDRNKSRMFCLTPDNKAFAMLEELLPYFVDTRLSLSAVPEYVNAENIGRLIRSGDLVACCVDNHHSRKLLSDHCATLDDVALFSVGNDGVGPDSTGVERQGTFAG